MLFWKLNPLGGALKFVSHASGKLSANQNMTWWRRIAANDHRLAADLPHDLSRKSHQSKTRATGQRLFDCRFMLNID